ncbi:MAG: membrane dipeptidase [Gemmatimonadetes bacterium]|nr:membrane dipeptidase [Gemmatimonadota bacterium]
MPQTRRLVIDGLGEIHLDYDMALIDEIRASGMRGCVVTVGNPALHGPEAFDDMRREIEGYDRHVAAHPDRLSRAVSVVDLDRAAAGGTIGLIYYTQNATPIQDDLERLRTLYHLGVRIVQLTYNTRNLLGDGCLERTNAGLSTFGVQVVERMNQTGMLVDLSHCGEATTLEASRSPPSPWRSPTPAARPCSIIPATRPTPGCARWRTRVASWGFTRSIPTSVPRSGTTWMTIYATLTTRRTWRGSITWGSGATASTGPFRIPRRRSRS